MTTRKNDRAVLPDSRLAVCAEMTEGDFVCDIGTDHGYLPAYLILSGKCRRAAAADINPMPLESARRTFEKAGIADKVSLYLSDGLKNVPLEGVTDIVMAGMGGELIYRIIFADGRLKSRRGNLILQPMTRAELLRENLYKSGFDIVCEKGVVSGKFVYTVLKCRYTGICREYESFKYYMGALDPLRDEDRAYIKAQIKRLERAAEGMKKSNRAGAEKLFSIASRLGKEIGA